ncbi:MAG: translocation/assembly module TamB domain-containing protein [bacterium]
MALAVLLFAAGLVVVLRQPVARFGVEIAARLLARSLNGRVEYERIEGDIFSNPTVVGLRIHLNGDSLRAERLTLRYAPFGFLFGRIPVLELNLVRPEVFISQRPVPVSAVVPADTARPRPFQLPRLSLDRLTVLDGRVYLNDTLRVDSIGLSASVRSNRASARFDLATMRAVAVREEVALRAASARGRLTPRTLLVDQLDVRTDRSRLAGTARFALDSGVVTLELASLAVDLAELSGPLAIEPGVLSGTFRARGKAGFGAASRSAELSYTVDSPAFGTMRLPDLAGTVRLDDPVLYLVVAGTDSVLGEFAIDGSLDYRRLAYRARARLRAVRLAGWDPKLPDIALDADLAVAGSGFDSVELDGGGRVTALGIDTFRIVGRRSGGRVDISRFDASGPSGRLQAAGTWGPASRVSGELVLEDVDIAPFARLAGFEATGRLKGLIHGGGTLDSVEVSGGVRLESFATGDVVIGAAVLELDIAVGRELHGRLAVGAEDLRIGQQQVDAVQLTLFNSEFDFRADRPGDLLTARGGYRLGRNRLWLDVTGLDFATGAETLALTAPFRVDWSPDSLAVRGVRFEIAEGKVELDAVRIGNSVPHVALLVRDLDLHKLQSLLQLDTELRGMVNAAVTGRDTLACELTVAGLEVPAFGVQLTHAALAARYSGSRVILDELRAVSNIDTSKVTGWAEFTTDDGFRLVAIDVAAQLADPGVWPLFFLRDIVDLRAGTIYGDLAIRGDLVTPDLSGRVRISRGRLWVPSVGVLVERVNAEVTAAGGRVNVEKVSGEAGTGIVTAAGFVELGPDWRVDTLAFDIWPEDAVISPMPEVHAVASGGIVVSLARNRPLSVEGTVSVREALLTFDFESETPRTAPAPGSDSVVFDIHIRGDRGLWLRNRMADLELSVDLWLKKTMQGETWTGQLATRQGNIYYLDRTLRVSRGEIRFENISSLNPELDIVAELPVRASNGENGALPDRILLTLSGTLNKPEFRFSSEPMVWDENEIITYLSLNVTPAEFDAFANREAVARYLSGRLLGLAQTQFTKQVRRWLTVDALRFESELTGGEGHKVTVGKYIGRSLYVTYTQNFVGEMVPEFRVEYYLDRRNEVVGERNEDGRFSVRYRHRLRY